MFLNAKRLGAAAVLLFAVGLVALACGGPSAQAKECTAGGSAEEAAFAQYFTSMSFAGGKPSTGEGGQEFSPAEPVTVQTEAKAETPARFCVQARGRTGDVAYDQEHRLAAGASTTDLGAFQKKGDYVIRVAVNDVLVRNMTFTVR